MKIPKDLIEQYKGSILINVNNYYNKLGFCGDFQSNLKDIRRRVFKLTS